MEERKLTDKDSLQLIEQMIGRAKQEEKTSGWGWIIWGWLLFIASVSHFVSIRAGKNYGNFIWNGFGVAAAILVILSAFSRKGKGGVRTYTGELVGKFGTAFFLSLLITVIGNASTGLNVSGANFGYLLLIYAFWMYIHGSAFRFRLLIAGAFINWAGALVIFLRAEQLGAYTLLVHAACVFLGYIIPGYLANREFGKSSIKKG